MRANRRLVVLGSVLLAFAVRGKACGDSWSEFTGLEALSADGSCFVFVDDRQNFVYVRGEAGPRPFTEFQDAIASVQTGEDVLARGKLPQLPMSLAVSSNGLGFAAIDHYASPGRLGDAVELLDGTGTLRFRYSLADIYTSAEITAFPRSPTGQTIWWRQASWIDDDARALVLLDELGGVRAIELGNGRVKPGSRALLIAALTHAPLRIRLAMVDELANPLDANALAAFKTTLETRTEPLGVRLRIASRLHARGDDSGRELVLNTARDPQSPERGAALGLLPGFPGSLVLPILRDALTGPTPGTREAAAKALAALGEEAVDVLLETLRDRKASPETRVAAARSLQVLGCARALLPLLESIEDECAPVGRAALEAAVATDGPALEPALVRLLEKGTAQDDPIAFALANTPTIANARALVRDLDRRLKRSDRGAREHDFHVEKIERALASLAGRSFGDDVVAWQRWAATLPAAHE
jgi:hypothetical protein